MKKYFVFIKKREDRIARFQFYITILHYLICTSGIYMIDVEVQASVHLSLFYFNSGIQDFRFLHDFRLPYNPGFFHTQK